MTDEEYQRELQEWLHSEANERKRAILLVACGIKDENMELRELVTDMYFHGLHPSNRQSVMDRMNELGIEAE